MKTEYDAIVLGSGIGGLTAAALLSRQFKKRVLVLEKNFKIGGLTHTFQRPGGYLWDVGVHYVGQMKPGSMAHNLMDFISRGELQWNPMPDEYDVFLYPDFQFRVPSNQARFQEALVQMFPHEQRAIERYFKILLRVMRWHGIQFAKNGLPRPVGWALDATSQFTKKTALKTTQTILDELFTDERLKSLLCSQWMDYGLPPSQSAFAIHALVTGSYLNGACYPIGSSKRIADTVVPTIQAEGGDVLVNHEAIELLRDKGRAIGVKSRHKGNLYEFRAPIVISNMGAELSYTRLVKDAWSSKIQSEIENFPKNLSGVILYLGLKEEPHKLGIKGENLWIHANWDHDENVKHSFEMLNGKAHTAFVSFPTLKDPDAKQPTAEILSMMDASFFEQWEKSEWRKRPGDYEEAKVQIQESLLELTERFVPGFRDLIAYKELGTPLSFEYFTNRPRGAFYGIPAIPERYSRRWLQTDTPIPGFYLCGSDVGSLGVMGAAFGSVFAVGKIMGFRAFGKMMKSLRATV